MPERRPRTRWERGWRPKGAWSFETHDDGTILFFPHAWGRGYVVPTRDKRREIEAYLDLWLIRIRAIDRLLNPLFFLAAGVLTLVFILPIFPLFSRFAPAIPGWYEIFNWTYPAFWVLVVLSYGNAVALSFVAKTAKAGLEKSDIRRSFVEMQRNRAQRSKWWRLWIFEAFSLGVVLAGFWFLWLSQTVMRPPYAIHAILIVAAVFLVMGVLMGLFGFWLIRIKRKSERADPG